MIPSPPYLDCSCGQDKAFETSKANDLGCREPLAGRGSSQPICCAGISRPGVWLHLENEIWWNNGK